MSFFERYLEGKRPQVVVGQTQDQWIEAGSGGNERSAQR